MRQNQKTSNNAGDCASFLMYLSDLVPMVEHPQARLA
jgi:hypothetical protein